MNAILPKFGFLIILKQYQTFKFICRLNTEMQTERDIHQGISVSERLIASTIEDFQSFKVWPDDVWIVTCPRLGKIKARPSPSFQELNIHRAMFPLGPGSMVITFRPTWTKRGGNVTDRELVIDCSCGYRGLEFLKVMYIYC